MRLSKGNRSGSGFAKVCKKTQQQKRGNPSNLLAQVTLLYNSGAMYAFMELSVRTVCAAQYY